MVSGFTVSETGKPEKPGKNRKQKLHLTDGSEILVCELLLIPARLVGLGVKEPQP